MKRHAPAMLCTALVAVSQALASPVDCQIEKSDHLVLIGKSLRISPDAGLWMAVQGKLRNGEEVSYAKDEPIVVADIKILRTTPSFVASTAVTLTSEGLIGPFNSLKARIAARSPIAALQEIALPDGRVFSIAPLNQDYAAVFNKTSGELCNVTIRYNAPDPFWSHGAATEPADATFEPKLREDVADSAGLRVIFNGMSAGQLNFQEVWTNGSAIRLSMTKAFDQFAKSVRIGLLDFDVVAIADGKITLRYNVQERFQVKADEVAKAGLRSGTFATSAVVRTRR